MHDTSTFADDLHTMVAEIQRDATPEALASQDVAIVILTAQLRPDGLADMRVLTNVTSDLAQDIAESFARRPANDPCGVTIPKRKLD